MKKKNILFTVTLILVFLIVGASVLYNYLDDKVQHDSLITQDPNTNNNDSSEDNNTKTETDEDFKKIPAPDFTVIDLEGNEYSLSDFQGKPVILNFWASWCGPCKSEMPDFEEVYQEYKDTIHFMFVNLTDGYQETLKKASSYIINQGYTFPVYYDTKMEAAYAYQATSIPVTYFIDAEGNFVASARGAIHKKIILQGIDLISKK